MPDVTIKTLPIAALALGALLLAPATGYAQGNSGADQYREGVPTGGGETPSEDVASTVPNEKGDSVEGGGSVANDNPAALPSSAGSEGERLADLTDATAPKRSDDDESKQGRRKQGRQGAADEKQPKPAAVTEGTEGEVEGSLTAGPGGLGWGMPALMALGLIAAIVYRLRNTTLDRRLDRN